MKKVIIFFIILLFVAALAQGMAVFLPDNLNLFFMPPFVILFSLRYLKFFYAIFMAIIFGYIIDVMGGYLIGINIFLIGSLLLVINELKIFYERITKNEFIFYLLIVSFLYRLLLLFICLIFYGKKMNLYFINLILGPLFDCMIMFILYPLINKLIHIFDQGDSLKKNIGLS